VGFCNLGLCSDLFLESFQSSCSNTLNYAPVTGGAVILVALILWVAVARKRYLGPVRTLRAEDSKTDETYSGGNFYPDPVYKNEYSVHGENAKAGATENS
jgi:hypothetical protein